MQSIKFLRPLSFSSAVYRVSAVKCGGFRLNITSVVQKVIVPPLSGFRVTCRNFSSSPETSFLVPVLDTEGKLFVQNSQPFTGHGEVKLERGIYTGDFVDGKRHGHGVYKNKHGIVFEGDWIDNHRNGNGIVTDAEGNIISEGLFKNGFIFSGTGSLRTKSGSLYTGEFLEGQRHGQGKAISKAGQVWKGEFIHGEPFNGKGCFAAREGVWVEGVFTAENKKPTVDDIV